MVARTLRVASFLLLVWLLATITVGMQAWIGGETVYASQLEGRREALHFGILANEAPGGKGWGAIGALSIQKRIGVVYLAEAVRQVTHLPVAKVYQLLDTVFLFAALLGLFFYLRHWVAPVHALIGVLYFSAVLPLTYFFQLFHPWDRIQLAIWIGLLYLVAERRFGWLALGLVLSMLVKFDTILLPGLYFLVHCTLPRWRRTLAETAVLGALAAGTYFALGLLFPSPLDTRGFDPGAAQDMLARNVRVMLDMNVRYPPFLVHALPALLSFFALRSGDRFVRASVLFACGLSAVYFSFSLYEEVRAHMVVLVLLLPPALISLSRLLREDGTGGRAAARQAVPRQPL